MQSTTVKVLSVHILQLSGFLRLLSSSPENICSLLWVKIDARSIFSFPGYHHRLRHSRFVVAQQHNPGGRAISKYSTFFSQNNISFAGGTHPVFWFLFFWKVFFLKSFLGGEACSLVFLFLGMRRTTFFGHRFRFHNMGFVFWVPKEWSKAEVV